MNDGRCLLFNGGECQLDSTITILLDVAGELNKTVMFVYVYHVIMSLKSDATPYLEVPSLALGLPLSEDFGQTALTFAYPQQKGMLTPSSGVALPL